MKAKLINVVWGLVLILGGALFLAQNLGYVVSTSSFFWMIVFGGLSAVFLVSYFASGVQHWGWLFPACIFAATAGTIGLDLLGVNSNLVAIPILLSVALPFLVAFGLNPRRNWWALIPSWVIIVVTVISQVADLIPGEFMAAVVLYSIALPFLVVFLLNRTNRWALIPAFVLAGVGLIPILATRLSGEFIAAGILFLIAIPYFVVYFWSSKNWWALIPAGILTSVGAGLAMLNYGGLAIDNPVLMNGIMFLGFSITFAVLWLRRFSQPTDWAKYPAAILFAIAVVILAFGSYSQLIWPLLLVVGGLVVLIFNLLPKRAQ